MALSPTQSVTYQSARRNLLGTRVQENRSAAGGSGGLSDSLTNLFNTGTDFLEPYMQPVLGTGKALVQLFLGLVGFTAGIVSAAIFKEGTMADWGSKALAFFGFVMSAFGIKSLMDVNKQSQAAHVIEPHFIKVGDLLSSGCKNVDKRLLKQDPAFKNVIDPNSPGYLYTNQTVVSGQDLGPDIQMLLDYYTSNGIINLVKSDSKGVEPAFDNLSEDYPISLGQYRDRVAVLLGNLVSSHPSPALPAAVLPNRLFRDLLTVNELTGERAKLLPAEFVGVFNMARAYADQHRNNNNSLDVIIGGKSKTDEIKALIANPVTGPRYSSVFAYLKKLQEAENDLKVLAEIISYVLDNSKTSDVTIARDVMILRQALACAFRIKGNNVGQINSVLKGILIGEQNPTAGAQPYDGLEGKGGKLEKLAARFEALEVEEYISNEVFPFEQVSIETENSDVLGGVMLQEFVEK